MLQSVDCDDIQVPDRWVEEIKHLVSNIIDVERGKPLERAAQDVGFSEDQFRLTRETMCLLRERYQDLVSENASLKSELLEQYRSLHRGPQNVEIFDQLTRWLGSKPRDYPWFDDEMPF